MDICHNKYKSPQFGALHIANSGKLKLYKLTDSSDFKFIKELSSNINMENLMPNLTKDEYSRWHEMLEYAVDNAQKQGNITYLEAIDNKPCGIITFTPGKTTILDCICTWPTSFGKKIKFAGKNLFYQMFQDFQELKGNKIKLHAITNGPYDTVQKYEALGFKKTSNVYPTKIEMEINCSKVKETITNLKKLFHHEKITPEKVNLYRELNI